MHKVSPQIMAFTFDDEPANPGDMVSLQCTVGKGDLPLEIDWYLNGIKIKQFDGISITRSSNRINTLTIESIKAEHGGLYACVASNKAGFANHTSMLVINGTSIQYSCCQNVLISVIFCFFKSKLYLFIYYIPFARFLKVSPQMTPFDFGEEILNAGDTVSLTCTVSKGDLPLDISWELNGLVLTTSNGILITRSGNRISMLSIDSVQAVHRGNYTCIAKNEAGKVWHTSHLNVNGRLLTYSIFTGTIFVLFPYTFIYYIVVKYF